MTPVSAERKPRASLPASRPMPLRPSRSAAAISPRSCPRQETRPIPVMTTVSTVFAVPAGIGFGGLERLEAEGAQIATGGASRDARRIVTDDCVLLLTD